MHSPCISRGIVATWYVNPGTYIYNEYRDYWETIAPTGGQELANHTMNHTGASTYDEIIYEVGQASREIWRIRGQEDYTSLIAFNRGGGTSWDEDFLAQVLEEYLNIDRLSYPGVHIEALSVLPGSTANEMFDIIPTVLEEGSIGHINFHGIADENGTPPIDWGNSAVWINEFEAFLDLLLGVQDELWIDGYTSVYKYKKEEEASTVVATHANDNTYIVSLATELNTNIYDEAITILLRLSPGWSSVLVENNNSEIPHSIVGDVLTFDIFPNAGDISIFRNDVEPITPSTVTASETEICNGQSSILYYTGGSGSTFNWYTSSCVGILLGQGNNLSVSPDETTTYYGRWETGSANSTCKSITIIVNNNPTAPESISASEQTICNGSSSTLSYTGGSGTSFSWYSNSCEGESIGVGNNLTITPTTTTTYFGRWENQCGHSNCQSVTVNVIDVPNQPSSVIGETVVCSGSLQNYLVENNADVNYHWSLPNDWSGCSSSNEIDVTIGNSGGIISVTPSNTCGEGQTTNLAVSLFETPIEATSVSASNETICNGTSTTLSYSGGSGTTFSWYSNSCGEELVGMGNNLEVAPTSTTTYFGHWENQCGYSNCQSVTINVIDVPNQLLNIFGETNPCIHSEITYSVESNTSLEYEWSLPQGYIGSSNTNQIKVVIGSTKGNIMVTPLNSCGYGISQELFIVPDTNITEIIEQPHSIDAKTGDDVSFNLSANGENLLYQWKFENNNIDGANDAVLNIHSVSEKDFGNYSVAVSGHCGLEQSETVILSIILSSEKHNLSEIKIFPNPSDGQFIIDNLMNLPYSPIVITNMYGKTIHQQILKKRKNTISLSKQPTGIYFIHFRINGQSLVKKVVIK